MECGTGTGTGTHSITNTDTRSHNTLPRTRMMIISRKQQQPRSSRLMLIPFSFLVTVVVFLSGILLNVRVVYFVDGEKAYPLGCSLRDRSYYDYENSVLPTTISTSTTTTIDNDNDNNKNAEKKKNIMIIDVPIKKNHDYLLVRKLGAGKFSDVFEAVDADAERERQRRRFSPPPKRIIASNDDDDSSSLSLSSSSSMIIDVETLVVLKCLKPIAERKIKRELLILQHASRLPNLAKIKAIVLPEDYNIHQNNNGSKIRSMPTLVLEHGHGDWFCHPIKQQQQRQRGKQQQQQQQQLHQNINDGDHNESTSSTIATGSTTTSTSASALTLTSTSYLTEYEIRFYLLHLLVALDHLHSCGIMHRDVKPRNVLIDRRWTSTSSTTTTTMTSSSSSSSKSISPLMLIDLGLADFYHPGTRYNVRVASRHYKSPELLIGSALGGCYDYCIDLWGVGCILAGLLFRREPFFRGKNNVDQLGVIIAVLGTTDLLQTISLQTASPRSSYELLPEDVRELIDDYLTKGIHINRRPWIEFLPRPTITTTDGTDGTTTIKNNNDPATSPVVQQQPQLSSLSSSTSSQKHLQQQTITLFQSQGMDLLDKLLVYDGNQRWTARQAMYHPFFDQVRRDVLSQVRLATQ